MHPSVCLSFGCPRLVCLNTIVTLRRLGMLYCSVGGFVLLSARVDASGSLLIECGKNCHYTRTGNNGIPIV